jgi:hypothetical protein
MLFGLIAVVQRRVPGVGRTTAHEQLRRELVHVLCEGPLSFSQIQKRLVKSMAEAPAFEQVLREVATCGEDGTFTVAKVPAFLPLLHCLCAHATRRRSSLSCIACVPMRLACLAPSSTTYPALSHSHAVEISHLLALLCVSAASPNLFPVRTVLAQTRLSALLRAVFLTICKRCVMLCFFFCCC